MDWGLMVIGFESGWYFLVERHVICKIIDFESGYFLVERHVIEAVRV